jgi:magnesium chelatase subunit D
MSGQAAWQDAGRVAEMLAVEPAWLGGVVLRGRAGQVRDAWLQRLRSLLGPELPWCKLPHHVSDERLLGGLDLTATLREGRPVAERGVLAQADGGVVVVAMSERIATGAAARIGITMDRGEVAFERDGLAGRAAARFGAVLLDEGIDDECVPAALAERCAFRLDLDAVTRRDLAAAAKEPLAGARRRILLARERWPRVRIGAATRRALCATALAFGVDSLRASLFAVRAACVAAALDGRREVEQDHATLAARLVIAPRATRLPPTPEEAPPEEATTPPPQSDAADAPQADCCEIDRELDDRVLEATHSALPPGLLALLRGGPPLRGAARQNSSRAGTGLRSRQRGRPLGSRAGSLRAGGRLHLVDTLRAAAPWQPLRRRERPDHSRIDVRPDDLRIRQFRQRTQTTLIFVVDASGSSALHRLGEAKGAVELMLADCYARRDQVALIAFRGKGAELLLPPTRSLSRARRSLAGLPGGGGTPLAAGVDAATALVEAARHRGETPLLVMLTDGRANIARDGTPGRPAAERDALAAARALRAREVATLLIDSAPAPQPVAQRLAEEMRARYLALPHADARLLQQAVRTGLVGAV